MNNKKKAFIFLPDGVGFRNFALTDFKTIGEAMGFEVIYWNNTPFELSRDFDFQEVRIKEKDQHPLIGMFSRARKHAELNVWTKKFNDPVYQTYKFPLSYNGLKARFKSALIGLLIKRFSSERGVERIRNKIKVLAQKSKKYNYCKLQLEAEQPDIIFCTSQRATEAIPALLAAQDLGIPTVTFIYSWDNVPKAMLVVETEYYFVWSDLMKAQLLQYYPFIKEQQITVTGTPQFEPHYDTSLIKTRAEFFKEHNLNVEKTYICYSGDDETTSPLDQYYLEDLAKAVEKLNAKGENIGIIYRKCPVDFTDRYDTVLQQNKDLIVAIPPLWEQYGKMWNQILPTKEDFSLLSNICEHTALVTNVCSSTVFDFAIHDKPCIYFNYEQPQLKKGIRDIGQNYEYVHFRSMPSQETVVFCTDKTNLAGQLTAILKGDLSNVSDTKKWYAIVAGQNPDNASRVIWNTINTILS